MIQFRLFISTKGELKPFKRYYWFFTTVSEEQETFSKCTCLIIIMKLEAVGGKGML